MLAEEALKDVTLVVFANKSDVDGAMTPDEIVNKLELVNLHGQ